MDYSYYYTGIPLPPAEIVPRLPGVQPRNLPGHFFLKQNLIGVGLAMFIVFLAAGFRRDGRANGLALAAFG
ncbi:MAG TPA: hypothetical protein VHO48_03065, partial [Anaerolineaceae bacterium]|nr:hypothetical protein [Anaerolineaceae bacterium]